MINKALNETVKSIRQKNLRKATIRDTANRWKEKDLLDGRVVDAGVVILPTKGCRWGRVSGCTMCGYVYEAGALDDEGILKIFKDALVDLGEPPYLKIFTSGSFFDEQEVSNQLRNSIIDVINEKRIKQLQVESRPGFLSKEGLSQVGENLNSKLEVGIGLETSNDLIRENCINKGFSFEDYRKAVKLCNSQGVFVKTYLLLKPPFILEREAIKDTIKSAFDSAKAGAAKVSINPMNIQKGTLVELLWKRREYRTPWLWSLVEVLKEVAKADLGIPVLSHPSGGGSRRGVHNCGKCNSEVLQAIREFSITQDRGVFGPLDCSCKRHWEDYLLLE
jgi:radical SAM enzyme (TIGR01210 family)